jgi:dihydropteroate synthase
MTQNFRCGRFELALDRPLVMAIINVTPDSFSGDGLANAPELVRERALKAVEAGADILDIGGESTRPGSAAVSIKEELNRVIPIIEALRPIGVPLSVDTLKPEVMRASLAAGADLINDINGFRAPGALEAVAASDCGLCVMHMQGEPRTMQQNPHYDDVVAEVADFLRERVGEIEGAGVARARILIDPGFGFGKTLVHNVALFEALQGFAQIAPTLVGVSRKSMIGAITGLPVEQRTVPSVVAAIAAARRGAAILRVHDVAETVAGLKIWKTLGPEKTVPGGKKI